MRHSSLRLACALALSFLGGCDGQDSFSTSVGLAEDPPRPVVAGQPYTFRVVGQSDGTFDSAKVLLFRGEVEADLSVGLTGDTLAVVVLDVEPGSSSFDVSATVTVPAGAVTRQEPGWLYIETENGRCVPGCRGLDGVSLELAPARPE